LNFFSESKTSQQTDYKSKQVFQNAKNLIREEIRDQNLFDNWVKVQQNQENRCQKVGIDKCT